MWLGDRQAVDGSIEKVRELERESESAASFQLSDSKTVGEVHGRLGSSKWDLLAS